MWFDVPLSKYNLIQQNFYFLHWRPLFFSYSLSLFIISFISSQNFVHPLDACAVVMNKHNIFFCSFLFITALFYSIFSLISHSLLFFLFTPLLCSHRHCWERMRRRRRRRRRNHFNEKCDFPLKTSSFLSQWDLFCSLMDKTLLIRDERINYKYIWTMNLERKVYSSSTRKGRNVLIVFLPRSFLLLKRKKSNANE